MAGVFTKMAGVFTEMAGVFTASHQEAAFSTVVQKRAVALTLAMKVFGNRRC